MHRKVDLDKIFLHLPSFLFDFLASVKMKKNTIDSSENIHTYNDYFLLNLYKH